MYEVSMIDGHIDEPKMTDNEIIKALECCSVGTFACDEQCPCFHSKSNLKVTSCRFELIGDALDLINRQKAENESLNNELHAKAEYIHEQRDVINEKKAEIERLSFINQRDEQRKKEADDKESNAICVLDYLYTAEIEENKKLKAEIERLKTDNLILSQKRINMFERLDFVSKAKSEAYKECIEKVKEEINEALKSNYKVRAERESRRPYSYLDCNVWNYCNGKIDCLRGLDDFLDNLLKEMAGDNNGRTQQADTESANT